MAIRLNNKFKPTVLDTNLEWSQSTLQSFYLFLDVLEDNIAIAESGDIIRAKCNNTVVGTVVWDNEPTAVPAMGETSDEFTENYCSSGDIPSFDLYKNDNNVIPLLNLIISPWEDKQISLVKQKGTLIDDDERYINVQMAQKYKNRTTGTFNNL